MSIQKQVEAYISERPSMRDAFRQSVVNYSKLARKIISEVKLKQSDFDAVLVSCRRFAYSIRKEQGSQRQIRELLKETKLEIKDRIAVFIVQRGVFHEDTLEFEKAVRQNQSFSNIIEGVKAMTIITEEENASLVKKYFKRYLLKEKHDLVEIILKSPPSLEDTPGVMAYLYSLFGQFGINIVETMSCWTDTIFIIRREDLEKALRVLRF